MIISLLAVAGLASAQGLAGSDCPFLACPPFEGAPKYNDNGTIGTTPNSFSIIGPPLQAVHASVERAPTGFAVDSSLNIYLTYPRNSGPTPNNVVIATSFTDEKPWPNPEIQNCTANQNASTCFINVQNVVLDPKDPEHVLWAVDSGIEPGSMTATPYGAKVMAFNLTNNGSLIRSYPIPLPLYHDGMNANDVRINNSVGTGGFAFITDESRNGSLVAIDLHSGAAIRRLFNTSVVKADPGYVGSYDGQPVYTWNGTQKSFTRTGSDGIALQSGNLYWGVLASRRFYYIPQTVLADFSLSDQEVLDAVVFPGQLGSEQAGFTADDKGVLYMTASEQNAIYQVQTLQRYVSEEVNGTPPGGEGPVAPDNYVVKTLVRSGLIQHADSAAIWDGYLYFYQDDKLKLKLSNKEPQIIHSIPYDPLWISTFDVVPSFLESFLRNQTLELLSRNNVIKVGDEIYIRGSQKTDHGAIEVEKVAKIIGMNKEVTKPYLVRPRVTVTHEGILRADLPTCRSPKEILKALNEVEPQGPLKLPDPWRTLQLRRGTLELGTLHHVRQAWQLWKCVIKGAKPRKNRKRKADHEQTVGSEEDDSEPVMQRQQTMYPQSSDQVNQSLGNQAQEAPQLSPPAVFQPEPVFQPVHHPMQTATHNNDSSEEPNQGTTTTSSYADRASSQTQSSDPSWLPPPPVFTSVYQLEMRFRDGKYLYPWEYEGRSQMHSYEYDALCSGPEPLYESTVQPRPQDWQEEQEENEDE